METDTVNTGQVMIIYLCVLVFRQQVNANPRVVLIFLVYKCFTLNLIMLCEFFQGRTEC